MPASPPSPPLSLVTPKGLTILEVPGVGWSNRGWGPRGARGARRPWWAWRSPLSRGAHSSSLARASWGALRTYNGTRELVGI